MLQVSDRNLTQKMIAVGSLVDRSNSERLRCFCNRLMDNRRTFAILESLSWLKTKYNLLRTMDLWHLDLGTLKITIPCRKCPDLKSGQFRYFILLQFYSMILRLLLKQSSHFRNGLLILGSRVKRYGGYEKSKKYVQVLVNPLPFNLMISFIGTTCP